MKPYKIIISGGGTGGHIYPAIAIANECKNRWPDCSILFVGANNRMEMEKVPAAGYEIKGLWISGLQRKLTIDNLSFPAKIMKSLWDAHGIITAFKPDIAIGTGGYASGPLLQMAAFKNIPTVIQEQNSFPGITNKMLSKKAKKICVAYENLDRFFPIHKTVLTGNPVRQDLLDIASKKDEAQLYFKLDPSKKTLLVLGGSLGARRINELIHENLDFLLAHVQIIWQCGKLYEETYKSSAREGVQVSAFINRMDLAYSTADFIISRAGAGTISELCIVGKPAILIPSPHVAEDHQTKNAEVLANANAAILIAEKNLDSDFKMTFEQLVIDSEEQEKLSRHIKSRALPDATKIIVNHIETLLHD